MELAARPVTNRTDAFNADMQEMLRILSGLNPNASKRAVLSLRRGIARICMHSALHLFPTSKRQPEDGAMADLFTVVAMASQGLFYHKRQPDCFPSTGVCSSVGSQLR